MILQLLLGPIAITSTCCLTAVSEDTIPAPGELRAKALRTMSPLPAKMPGAEKDTPARIELGKKLYFDKLLSANNTISCNSCHLVDNNDGGDDGEPTSAGAFGKHGGRNAPTVLNAGFQFAQFWDGRAATLEDQAKGPILNPIEMAMPKDEDVLKRVEASSEYPAVFQKAFPGVGKPITYDNLAAAIASFERTLITHDRFDDFLKGDDKALSQGELKGLDQYFKAGCASCHTGPLLGGNRYMKMGIANAYSNKEDLGRFDVTKEESDKYKFKVPTLRNIELTAPYFHDGKAATLEQSVADMAWLQSGKKLSDDETKSIVQFLKTLTDKPRIPKKTAMR
jgi:cytochrome c peroxidase